jgi:hypothetical protein
MNVRTLTPAETEVVTLALGAIALDGAFSEERRSIAVKLITEPDWFDYPSTEPVLTIGGGERHAAPR